MLDASIPEDEDVLKVLDLYRPNITALEKMFVGSTMVKLEGSATVCRRQECNLGNLIADSMVYARALELKEPTPGTWTDAAIAFIQGGGKSNMLNRRKIILYI